MRLSVYSVRHQRNFLEEDLRARGGVVDKLIIIVHGRSASTLMLRMLYETKLFKLWGTPPIGECTPFINNPRTWNKPTIIKEWNKIYVPGDHILAKLPAFSFFIEEILILEPAVIVLERSILDIIRSYIAVGWVSQLHKLHAQFGIDRKAIKKYEELGGTLHPKDPYHLLAVTYAYSHWKTRMALEKYPRSLTIHYQDLMTKPNNVFTQLEEFLGLEAGVHRSNWHRLMKKRHQSTGRPIKLEYYKPLYADISPASIGFIEDAIQKFENP